MESLEEKEYIENQNLNISNAFWNIEISYSKINSEREKYGIEKTIELQNEYKTSSVFIYIQEKSTKTTKSIELNGIDGAFYLHKSTEKDQSQSVKLDENNLILSLGFTLFSLNLKKTEIDWLLRPDIAEIFEFYDLEEDILLRGECEIHRVDKNGTLKWSFGGRDIWVNLEGKKELNIEKNSIRLFDFESNEYLINFDGELLNEKQKIIKTTLFTNPKRWFYQKVWERMTKNRNK
jgi:hypothetical protein